MDRSIAMDSFSRQPAFIHPQAIVDESATIGSGSRVWAFTHILGGARVGSDCNLCDHVFIEGQVIIGDRVTLKSGVYLWDGIHIEDDVFIGPNATFTNDKFPRSGHQPPQYPRLLVRRGASIGANATILPGITIGAGAMIGAGSVVTKDVPPNAIVAGNPARISGYVSTDQLTAWRDGKSEKLSCPILPVAHTKLYPLHTVTDIRGSLAVGEYGKEVPFIPQRFFIVFDVPTKETRGEHAHRELQQLLVCLHGSCVVILDDGSARTEVVLDSPSIGLYIGPMIWSTQYRFSPDAMLLVLASDSYDPDDYIRDYDTFLAAVKP